MKPGAWPRDWLPKLPTELLDGRRNDQSPEIFGARGLRFGIFFHNPFERCCSIACGPTFPLGCSIKSCKHPSLHFACDTGLWHQILLKKQMTSNNHFWEQHVTKTKQCQISSSFLCDLCVVLRVLSVPFALWALQYSSWDLLKAEIGGSERKEINGPDEIWAMNSNGCQWMPMVCTQKSACGWWGWSFCECCCPLLKMWLRWFLGNSVGNAAMSHESIRFILWSMLWKQLQSTKMAAAGSQGFSSHWGIENRSWPSPWWQIHYSRQSWPRRSKMSMYSLLP